MIKNIYLYGTTVGFEITPVDDTAGYYECFYDGSKIDRKFIVSQSNNIVRYNYLRYNNIIGSGGRENSFFGLCLVMEGEYIDKPHKLFKLFESIFKRTVQNNKILIHTNGNYKYKGSFKDLPNEVEDLKSTLKFLIQSEFSKDIVPLTNNLNIPYHNKVTYFDFNNTNLIDAEINQVFLECGRIEFNNKAGTTEVISIEQFSDFKKESKNFSDFRKSFADKTSSIQNEWITNSNINKNNYRNKISETINPSIQELNKLQNIISILSKNQNLNYVVELNKKYIDNFNSINNNREKLNALLKIDNNSKQNTNSPSKTPSFISDEIIPLDQNIKQDDKKTFPTLSKYAKPILIGGSLIIISAIGYFLYPKANSEPVTPVVKSIPTQPSNTNDTIIKPNLPISYGYSNNPKVDSIINLITIADNKNDTIQVNVLLDYLKKKIGIGNYNLTSAYPLKNLNDLRAKYTKVVDGKKDSNSHNTVAQANRQEVQDAVNAKKRKEQDAANVKKKKIQDIANAKKRKEQDAANTKKKKIQDIANAKKRKEQDAVNAKKKNSDNTKLNPNTKYK